MDIFDTQLRTPVNVAPMDGQTYRFYCCGPTVYGPAHIGNFRTFVAQDVFRRVVELGGIPTKHVRNLTDVDDKTIRDSQKNGLSLNDFTTLWKDKFHADCAALNCLPPHIEPSAVEHIPHQIAMVEKLIENGHAYPSDDGSVYFAIDSYKNYGQLSHLDERELDLGKTAQTRSDADEYEKDSVADFVLWKAWKPSDGENRWDSPWGPGRPGWHLECSAMIYEYLGKDFDLHSGGVDLVFPHHENEVAQSKCAYGGGFAKHWFHVTHLLVNGGKMSKSLGNMYTLSDLEALGFSPALVRYVLVSGYYRRPLNFLLDSLSDAKTALQRLSRFERRLAKAAGSPTAPTYEELCASRPELGPFAEAWASLNDDLNTPEALGHIFSALKRIQPDELKQDEALALYQAYHFILNALGLILLAEEGSDVAIPDEVKELAERRWQAKLSKDWAQADTLRNELTALGWTAKDGKDGYTLLPVE